MTEKIFMTKLLLCKIQTNLKSQTDLVFIPSLAKFAYLGFSSFWPGALSVAMVSFICQPAKKQEKTDVTFYCIILEMSYYIT